MKIIKILCDCCGATIEDEHSPRIVTQVYAKSDRATNPSKWVNDKVIHLCDKCNQQFEALIATRSE